MKTEFWQNKKVLITGVTGFIGSHMAQKLLNAGASVVGVSRNVLGPEIRKIRGFGDLETNSKFQLKYQSLESAESLLKIFNTYKPDTVFHFAASAIVSEAAKNPSLTISGNVIGTLNVLEASRLNAVKRVLIASSDKCYGDHATDPTEALPYKESYALRGLDIYSASKTCSDMLAQAYAFQYKIPIAIARSCNVYGPGDLNVTRLIPRTVLRLLSGSPGQIKLGHEKVLREYIYIEDALEAYLLLAEQIEGCYGPAGELMPASGKEPFGWPAFNIGSYTKEQVKSISQCENIKSVSRVIADLSSCILKVEPETIARTPEFMEIPDEYSDSSKLLSLGFTPQVKFSQGITQTITWYKENFEYLKKLLI